MPSGFAPPVSTARARRIAVRAQALDGSSPSVLACVQRLGSLQLDPTARLAPSHLLVLWSRLGEYAPAELDRLLWQARELFEWRAFIWPAEAMPALRSVMRRWPRGDTAWPRRVREWLRVNEVFRRYVLSELEQRGPLLSRHLEDRACVPWISAGWTGNRNVGQMLEFLNARGEIAIVGRAGRQRLWDLAGRWYPPGEPMPHADADAWLAERRFRALGVEWRNGRWIAHPDADDRPVRRATLLSPFDRLIHDRQRTELLFGFRYRIEIYVPKAQRQYGYFVLPILSGGRLAGRIDPELDRKHGILRINAMHWEDGPADIDKPVRSLARFLGAHNVEWP
jgi:uncharacterized protein YcaQ